MKKTLCLLLLSASLHFAFGQKPVRNNAQFTDLALKLHATYVLVNAYIIYGSGNEQSSGLRNKIEGNCFAAKQIIEANKNGLLLKLGKTGFDDMQTQLTGYDQAGSKSDLTPDQLQSAILWLKLSEKKVDDLVIKLIN